jgi:hypothetical protein
MRKKSMKAWLITWVWASDSAKEAINPDMKIILNSRFSSERVIAMAEQIYISNFFSLAEQAEYVKRTSYYKRMFNHLFAYQSLRGVPWTASFTFGHHPYLHGRLVDDLRVIRDERGKEVVEFKELKPRFAE